MQLLRGRTTRIDRNAGDLPASEREIPGVGCCRVMAFHPDAHTLATIENERTVTLRDAETFQPRRTYDFAMPRVKCVALTPDGTRCVVGNSRGKVLLFDVE